MRTTISVLARDLPAQDRLNIRQYSAQPTFEIELARGPVTVPFGNRGTRGFRQVGTSVSMGSWGGPTAFTAEAEPVTLASDEYAIVGTLGNFRCAWFIAGPRAMARLSTPGAGLGDLDLAEGILASDHDTRMEVFLDWRSHFVNGQQGLTGGEQRALGIFGSLKSHARPDALRASGLGPYDSVSNEHLAGLVAKGLIQVRSNGAMVLQPEGRVCYGNLPAAYK